MKDLEELFLHELRDIYDAEQRLVDATEDMARSSVDPEIRQAFREHHEETRRHVKRVAQAFKVLGKKARREPCAGILGLIKEHHAVVKDLSPKGHILDLINLGAAQKVERYEMTAYAGLIHLAETLGHTEVVDLLNENLMEEQSTFDRLHSLQEDYDVEAAAEKRPDEAPRKSARRPAERKATGGKRAQAVAATSGRGRRTGSATRAGTRGGAPKGARGGNKRKTGSRSR